MHDIPTLVRGSTSPALTLTISDSAADADFSGLVPGDVKVQVELAGELIVDDFATAVVPAQDGKSATVVRNWAAGETDEPGRYWVTAYVVPFDQSFPDDGPLRLDVVRAPGDI
jgi:hypothetical protein